jgi:hypothetical protein
MAFDELKPLGGDMIKNTDSAGLFARQILGSIAQDDPADLWVLKFLDFIADLIRSRDKAIIDRCKEAINDLPNCNGDPSRGEALDNCIDAIDSVLKEL